MSTTERVLNNFALSAGWLHDCWLACPRGRQGPFNHRSCHPDRDRTRERAWTTTQKVMFHTMECNVKPCIVTIYEYTMACHRQLYSTSLIEGEGRQGNGWYILEHTYRSCSYKMRTAVWVDNADQSVEERSRTHHNHIKRTPLSLNSVIGT